ncbi:hypothetical protein AUR04nite_35060 [Glutamicibacter uratoxydans]|uniref:Uncharacterized protein n=1 Tax=Glutamicibacter uratoxydans TaxID=43667 RepID=A0A4Y4DW29_GLUUR|nr:hypothetical protein AUR04nite_35060 [Glutamicibacter uratoxydans]
MAKRPIQINESVLDRLAQGIQHTRIEVRYLIEEEHSVVGSRYCAREYPSSSSAN